MTAKAILAELEKLGTEPYRRILAKHGVQEKAFGVSVADMKKIQKRVKKDYQLALDLYDSGVYDAMYLAGLIADDLAMTKKDLQRWVDRTKTPMLCGYTVAWVAAESRFGWELALEWIESKKETVASAGWSTLSSLVATKNDAELDLAALKKLLARVEKTVHGAQNRVRYSMMGFVSALGCSVKPLTAEAIAAAKRIGSVSVDMGDTECKVPSPITYIEKAKARGSLGKKRKSAKC